MRLVTMFLGLLFLALCHPSSAQSAGEERTVRVVEGAPLWVECPLRVEQRAQWRRDGGALPAGVAAAGESAGTGGAVTARLHAAAAHAHHAGVYTCARGPTAARVRVLVSPAAPSAPSASPAGTTEAVGSASVAPPTTTLSPINDWRDVVYELLRNITLDCKPSNGLEPPTEGFTWTANGTAIEQVSVLQGRYELRSNGAELHVTRASEDDWGTYKCAVDGEGARGFHVTAKPVLRLPPNSNVVEGQKLKLTCRVLGRPYPTVVWKYAPLGINETVDALEFLHERGSVNVSSAGVPGGELVLTAASATDGGNYTCEAPGTGALPAHTILRVKDMYAALWPFLGICAEVFVLCAIILVYEKRRTKPELDDSDTDNHDQKTS